MYDGRMFHVRPDTEKKALFESVETGEGWFKV